MQCFTMVRKLPWKDQSGGNSLARSSADDDGPSELLERQSQPRHTEVDERPKTNKHSDDWNYRLTESDFVATAKLFTAVMHEEAYRKLLERQRRDAERYTTIDDLLDQPLVQQALPQLPPSNSTSKPLPRPMESDSVNTRSSLLKPQPTTCAVETETGNKRATFKIEASTNLLSTKSEPENPAIQQSSIGPESWIQPVESKPTAAALARKRKRQQAQQMDTDLIPPF